MKTSRNDPCPCGSGKRYKHCCGAIAAEPSSGMGSGAFHISLAFQAALKNLHAGHLQEAGATCRQILAADPSHNDALDMLGFIACQSGNHGEALEFIAREPANPIAHINLGNVLTDQGRLDEAIGCYRKALSLKPDFADAHYNLAGVLKTQGKLDEAVACYREAISLNPDFAEAYGDLGTALKAQGKLDEAVESYRKALSFRPDFAETHNNLGNALKDQGQLDQAVECFRQAISLKPDFAGAHNNLGNALKDHGQLDQAVACYREAISIDPDFAGAHNNLGTAFRDQDKLDEAVACYHKALALAPEFAEAHNNLGLALQEQGQLDEAIASYRQALALNPDFAEAHSNLGNVLKDQGKLDEAVERHRKAISLKPDYAEAHNNLGNALKDQGKLDEAADCYHKAISLSPDYADAHYNLGLLLLQTGDVRNGWEEYEYRWRKSDPMLPPAFPQPWWHGEDLQEKTILVWDEQGVGGKLRFASLIPDLSRLAGHCILECEPRLASLLTRSFPTVEVIPRSDPPHPRISASDIDYQSPAGNLARWLRPSLASFPKHNGYLLADSNRISYWRDRLATLGAGPKVGISWRSSLMTGSRANSHTRLDQWGPILGMPEIAFINLQYGECREELEQAEQQFGIRIHRWDDIDLKNDLDEVAALTMALDLVVSTPSVVSVIPGALGKPVWRMDVRHAHWDILGRDSIPWYPSMRLFYRERDKDWAHVIGMVAQELRQMADKKQSHGDVSPRGDSFQS